MNISMRDVHYTYPSGMEALRGITLDIGPGERVAIVGQNGSGKTTLAKHLNGLLRPAGGEVLIGDWNTRAHSAAQMARRVGYVFQNPTEQIFRNRVADEVAFGPQNLKLAPGETGARVAAALARTGLGDYGDAHPYELLPAQRKWVALASVLAMNPDVFVLDEPTTGQDARGLARLGALVDALAREGKTVVTIAHDVDFIAEHFARVVALWQGRIVADGDKHEVFAQSGVLAQTFVEPPQMTRLGMALGLAQTATTVDELLEARRTAP